MNEFVWFGFLLFTANKSISSVRFLGESTARQSAFWFYLTFNDFYLKSFETFSSTQGSIEIKSFSGIPNSKVAKTTPETRKRPRNYTNPGSRWPSTLAMVLPLHTCSVHVQLLQPEKSLTIFLTLRGHSLTTLTTVFLTTPLFWYIPPYKGWQ